MYIIYKITNKINNKIYIGFTHKTAKGRFNQHCYISKNPNNKSFSILHKAIKKYGRQNFLYNTVYMSNNKDEVLSKEDTFIKYYNSLLPNGYNIIKGGSMPPSWSGKKHKNITKQKISDALTLFYSKPQNKIKHQKENNPNYGHKWSNELKNHLSKQKIGKYINGNNPNSKKIKITFPSGKILFFNCIKEAALYLNINPHTLSNNINKINSHHNSKLKNILIEYKKN